MKQVYECPGDGGGSGGGGYLGGGGGSTGGGDTGGGGGGNGSGSGGSTGGNNDGDLPTLEPINTFLTRIDETQLKPCMKTILADIKKLSKGSVAGIIQKFAGTYPGYNWVLKDGTLGGGTGETQPPAFYNKSTGTVTTTFDSQSWTNATNLSWARTILHESIHAYLVAFYATNRPGWVATYPQMVQDWGVLQNWNDVHHEEFARSLTSEIAIALEEYGKMKGYTLTQQFYQDMAWAGLQTTSTFKKLPPADQQKILNIIAIELTGSDTSGRSKPQKGKNAGC